MKNVGCPVDFFEEITAMFRMKISQIDTKNNKIHKVFQFSKNLCIFCENCPELTSEKSLIQKFPNFHYFCSFFVKTSIDLVD